MLPMTRLVTRGVRRAVRYGKYAKRLTRVMRPLYKSFVKKKITNSVHRFIRWADKDVTFGTYGPNSILETGANQNLTYQFNLTNVVNSSDFTNLYDMYRINKILIYLEPVYNNSDRINGPINRKIRVVHDYNDATPLTQEDDYLEYSNCKSYNSVTDKTVKIVLYPKINNIVENAGGVASAFTSVSSNKVWLNMDTPLVPHFGIKVFVPVGISTPEGSLIYKVRVKFDISLKNSK